MSQLTMENEANEFLTNIFPFDKSDLVKTSLAVKESKVNMDNFRLFLYKNIFEEKTAKNLLEKESIFTIFYWYVLEKIEEYYPIFSDFLLENIFVEDYFHIPMYKIKYNTNFSSSNDNIKSFFNNFIEMVGKIESYENKELFEWFIKKLFYDVLCRDYILTKEEIIPNVISKIKGSNLEFYTLNEKEIEKLLNITFSNVQKFPLTPNI